MMNTVDLIENTWTYIGLLTLSCIVSFGVGMLAGMVWTVFL